jgi:3-deoxy-D-manno-octulosonate 8-phosphate phosphatase (KDO 8-P phosphatase)
LSSSSSASDRAENIKLIAFDVDGVLTNGELIFSSGLGEIKTFHAHDGLGLKLLKSSGCEVAIVSSRASNIVSERFKELGIIEIHQNQDNKGETLRILMNKYDLKRSNVAFAGDDLPDISAMELSGFAIAVANAHPLVKQQADWITTKQGGNGAAREICDLILTAQGNMGEALNGFSGR